MIPFRKFLLLQELKALEYIQQLFIVFVFISVMAGAVLTFLGFVMGKEAEFGVVVLWVGILLVFVVPVLLRIFAELFIVVFRINDTLNVIQQNVFRINESLNDIRQYTAKP